MDLIPKIKKLGLTDKSAKVYMAALELVECTILQIARHSGLKRTTLYYLLSELIEFGALKQLQRHNKTYYVAESPINLFKRARERIEEFEDYLDVFEQYDRNVKMRPRTYFLFGSTGFKQAWERLFQSKGKKFSIITESENFLQFVKEKYILKEIIKIKKDSGFYSRQLIPDSPYARKIIAKDKTENRDSKILPFRTNLPFTTIVNSELVIFISTKFDNMVMVMENVDFARTIQAYFDLIWNLVQ